MEGKGSFFILLIIVAILTLTLAVLAGYLFFVSGTPKTPTAEAATQPAEIKPTEKDLGHHKLFDGKQYFNLKSEEDSKVSIIMLGMQLDYFKSKNAEQDTEKITAFDGKIKETIGTYFQNMTLEEARKPETKVKAKEDLKKKFNELMADKKTKKDFVYEVIFYEWFCQ